MTTKPIPCQFFDINAPKYLKTSPKLILITRQPSFSQSRQLQIDRQYKARLK